MQYLSVTVKVIFFIGFFFALHIQAQNLGGSATYNFLKLAAAPQVNALGGVVVALQNNDVNIVHQNPAQLQQTYLQQLGANVNFMYGGIKNIFVNYTTGISKKNLPIHTAAHYINYGNTIATDAAGNNIGNFSAHDYALQVSTATHYKEKWNIGATTKLIGSNYGSYSSFALALDIGATYTDTSELLQAAVVFKNIGGQLKPYTGSAREPLPFDFQLGFSKKLAKAPLQFVFTATNVHQFDIRYADTAFERAINGDVAKGKFTIDKLFRHIIVGAQVYPSKQTELSIAYNYLRRKELGLYNIGNVFTGLSVGFGLLQKSYQIRYARSYYQNAKAFHQLGFTLDFKHLLH